MSTIKNKYDRRRKLTEVQKEEIKNLKGKDTQTNVARLYGVNRRTIDFIWNPEKLERNKQLREARGGSAVYYDKEKHREAMRKTRAYKKELKQKGLL